jgi:hypothetical protein
MVRLLARWRYGRESPPFDGSMSPPSGTYSWRFVVGVVALGSMPVGAFGQSDPPSPAGQVNYQPPKIGLVVVYDMHVTTTIDGRAQSARDEVIVEITGVASDSVTSRFTTAFGIQTRRSLRGVFTYEFEGPDGGYRLLGDFGAFHRLWPLAVGKTAELSLDRQTAQRDQATQNMGEYRTVGKERVNWRVEGEAPVKVGTVEFRTVRLIRDEVLEPAEDSTALVSNLRIYFAPELGWYLRVETTNEFPELKRNDVILWEAREIRGR